MPGCVSLYNAYKGRKQKPGEELKKVPQMFTFLRREGRAYSKVYCYWICFHFCGMSSCYPPIPATSGVLHLLRSSWRWISAGHRGEGSEEAQGGWEQQRHILLSENEHVGHGFVPRPFVGIPCWSPSVKWPFLGPNFPEHSPCSDSTEVGWGACCRAYPSCQDFESRLPPLSQNIPVLWDVDGWKPS